MPSKADREVLTATSSTELGLPMQILNMEPLDSRVYIACNCAVSHIGNKDKVSRLIDRLGSHYLY